MLRKTLCKILKCPCPETELDPIVKQPADIQMRTSSVGIDLIKEFEGFSSTPYWDSTGKVWTIGYGITGKGVTKNTPAISEQQATKLLMDHVALVEEGVHKLVTAPINQNQFDALVSFAYNVGLDIDDDTQAEGLGDSTLLRLLNLHRYFDAADEFPKWVYSGGIKLAGLVRRRNREKELFLS